MPGIFIQRQAEAVSSDCNVTVLYVHADEHAVNNYEIDIAEEQGITVVRVYYHDAKASFLNGLLKMYRFWHAHQLGFKVLRTFKPDLIHVHVLTREGVIAFLHKIIRGIPYVITEHWSRYLPGNNSFKGACRKLITRRVVKSAASMISVSDSLRSAMLNYRLVNKNFTVVPNPVDTNLFTPGEQGTVRKLKRFIHISCFEDRPKNISGLLDAVKILSGKRSDFECWLIGDGPEFQQWKSRADELGLNGKQVFFTGLKEQKELIREIQDSGFMVLSSNYETFGTVVVECLACGIPVVATNVGIVPEIINNTNGIVVPVGDGRSLVNAIDKMLDTCGSYDPLVIRRPILNKFDSKTIANQLLEIYNLSVTK